ncbi:hypothetical protein COCCADRAFT_96159 [Bipolaris zeicola 26-R-13]|uniref:FAD-binding domain-containing protein n=1 Tax=Cochliobolus carbonum (strain 26-R-13) TaxID=930089 RepID=W6YPP4_COCC2|nr:uncharacterized protein COCCADRAFT_96159 [Bipolaris zeicola 26-R-13]EUC33411.1 hypothetical protein COCCADRAFT_96159 [Bipolaris zeicola 26-R-13]
MRRLGLLEELRQYCVNETGMELIDLHGKSLMKFGVTKAGDKGGTFELTNEFEFMRGDFVKMMYTASLADRQTLTTKGHTSGSLTYLFNTTLTAISQDTTTPDLATATFSTSETRSYNLIVAADGQNSRTRRLVFGEAVNTSAYTSLNTHAAFFPIPRSPNETSLARMYSSPENRLTMTRSGDRPETQVYLIQMANAHRTPVLKAAQKLPVKEQKKVWAELYRDAGWECERFVRELDGAEDFYATEIVQVKMPGRQLYSGRVVLLGDAGYCPSPFTGMGTTLALIGAYVLVGELGKHAGDVGAALRAYQEEMKEPVEENQKLGALVNGGKGMFPRSAWGIWAVNTVLWTMAVLRVDKVLGMLAGLVPEGKDSVWKVPEYPGMNMDAL